MQNESASAQLPVLTILFEEKLYTGPKPVPQATINELVSQLVNVPGIQVTTATAISGAGDQVVFFAATISQGSITAYVGAFYVLDRNVVFMCDDFHTGGAAPSDTVRQSALQQCAHLVVKQL